MKSLMTPEMQDASNMMAKISELQNNINNLQSYLQKRQSELQKIDDEISRKRAQLVILDDEILVQEFGLYRPTFDFASSLDYKEDNECDDIVSKVKYTNYNASLDRIYK